MSDIYLRVSEEDQTTNQAKKRRRTRWEESSPAFASSLALVPKFLSGHLTVEQQQALAIRVRIEELTRKCVANDVDLKFFVESNPNPEPIYDNHGKRINTKEQRAKDKLLEERELLVDQAFTMNPNFVPPTDFYGRTTKRFKKIYIPVDKFPDYNFFGLIVGPRGNSQKQLERETGCKIAIRGKGSLKPGKVKQEEKFNPADEDNLHVLVTADNQISLEKAAKRIQELLIPREDRDNKLKQDQLLQLADLNGTRTQRMWAMEERTWERTVVRCEICGDASHPSGDCPLRSKDIPLPPAKKEAMNTEYNKFLEEVASLESTSQAYDHFMDSLSAQDNSFWKPTPVAPWQTNQTGTGLPWQGASYY